MSALTPTALPSENTLTTFYPHFLTLTALIYLLGPSAASITLILSITAITACLLLRPASLPASHAAAIVAASTAELHSPREVRGFYYGYIKGFEDGRAEAVVEEDVRSEGTVGTRSRSGKVGGICGPAMVWKDRPAFSASTGGSRGGSTAG